MELDRLTCHRALLARDLRFDGLFFTCVITTGIYCRSICPARPPRIENCQFVASAAAAQEAGYRACLRCRPDVSPGSPAWRGTATTVGRALRLIGDGALDNGTVSDLALRLGVGERHLRRLFTEHLGASPLTVALTRRTLIAKQLLHDSELGMMDVALAAGFKSLRRFNEVFNDQFGRPPSSLRSKAVASDCAAEACVKVDLPYRPPYDWEAMLAFLATRAIPGVEETANGLYRRTIVVDGMQGWLQVGHASERNSLEAEINIGSLPAIAKVIERLKRLFDTTCDPRAIRHVLERAQPLSALTRLRPGLRLPGAWDGFELGVRAIVGQQITVAAASKLAGRLTARFGEQLTRDGSGLTHVFPTPSQLADAELEAAGMPRHRAGTIRTFARAVLDDPRLVTGELELAETKDRLQQISGIGSWTANYFAMRVLQDSDAFLAGDAALRRIFARFGVASTHPSLEQLTQDWRPWRAYGVLHLWTAESEGDLDELAA